jgi:hypothetical protein
MDGRRFRTEAGGRVRKFIRHPRTLSDLSRKVLSFGYFSLHQQRKVTRRQAKALRSSAKSLYVRRATSYEVKAAFVRQLHPPRKTGAGPARRMR